RDAPRLLGMKANQRRGWPAPCVKHPWLEIERLTLRIAQVAPLFESVPPKCYGGTERVVSYLTEELVRQGHEVTLFASGDSVTTASLVPACRRSLRLDPRCQNPMTHHLVMLEQ